jgi:GAF domain/ANTAR domain
MEPEWVRRGCRNEPMIGELMADVEPDNPLNEIAAAFGDLVHLLVDGQSLELKPTRIVMLAVRAITPAESAWLTVVTDGVLRTEASTHATANWIDQVQAEIGDGPAWEALEVSEAVRLDDVTADRRWPRLADRIGRELGACSMLSVRIYLSQRHRAVLNFLSTWPEAFDDEAEATAAIFASFCSLALLTRLLRDEKIQLRRAQESYREIGIAIGILMARESVSAPDALQLLHRASTALRRSLPELAADVARAGRMPS